MPPHADTHGSGNAALNGLRVITEHDKNRTWFFAAWMMSRYGRPRAAQAKICSTNSVAGTPPGSTSNSGGGGGTYGTTNHSWWGPVRGGPGPSPRQSSPEQEQVQRLGPPPAGGSNRQPLPNLLPRVWRGERSVLPLDQNPGPDTTTHHRRHNNPGGPHDTPMTRAVPSSTRPQTFKQLRSKKEFRRLPVAFNKHVMVPQQVRSPGPLDCRLKLAARHWTMPRCLETWTHQSNTHKHRTSVNIPPLEGKMATTYLDKVREP